MIKNIIVSILLIGLFASCSRPISTNQYKSDLFVDIYTTSIDTFVTFENGIYVGDHNNVSCLPPRGALYINAVLLNCYWLDNNDAESRGIYVDSTGAINSIDYEIKVKE